MKREFIYTMLLVAIAFISASATIINIPADYPTIQEGIDASSDGDTVLVQPGIYVENINFNGHNIVVGSLFLTTADTSYISSTIIDGNESERVVKFVGEEDSTAVITGFTIQNGYTEYPEYGGGIYCANNSSPTITHNAISENSAHRGGGIYCDNSNPTITNNIIDGNSSDSFGGGIYCLISNPIISNNIISSNSAYGGGGIYCSSSNPMIINNTIIENSVQSGGGISCYFSNPTIKGNFINHNYASAYGGGIWCPYSACPSIENNSIYKNTAQYGGGIFCINNSNPAINQNTISENSAIFGGGIVCRESNPIITNTIFWADTAFVESNEIYISECSPLIIYCDIQGGWEGEGNIDCDPLFCYPDTGNFYLAENSCCVGAGCDSLGNPDSTVDIGAFGVGCPAIGCDYVPGDINGDGHVNGSDVTYGIRYFTGTGAPPPDSCWNDSTESWLYSAGDANGNCRFSGSDILFLINVDGNPEILWCPQTPPINPPLGRLRR